MAPIGGSHSLEGSAGTPAAPGPPVFKFAVVDSLPGTFIRDQQVLSISLATLSESTLSTSFISSTVLMSMDTTPILVNGTPTQLV